MTHVIGLLLGKELLEMVKSGGSNLLQHGRIKQLNGDTLVEEWLSLQGRTKQLLGDNLVEECLSSPGQAKGFDCRVSFPSHIPVSRSLWKHVAGVGVQKNGYEPLYSEKNHERKRLRTLVGPSHPSACMHPSMDG